MGLEDRIKTKAYIHPPFKVAIRPAWNFFKDPTHGMIRGYHWGPKRAPSFRVARGAEPSYTRLPSSGNPSAPPVHPPATQWIPNENPVRYQWQCQYKHRGFPEEARCIASGLQVRGGQTTFMIRGALISWVEKWKKRKEKDRWACSAPTRRARFRLSQRSWASRIRRAMKSSTEKAVSLELPQCALVGSHALIALPGLPTSSRFEEFGSLLGV